MIRKISCFLICTAMLCMGAVVVNAATPQASLGSAGGKAGDSVQMTLTLSDCAGFANLGLEIGYDSSVLTLTSAVNSVPGATYAPSQYYTVNPYSMTWYSTLNNMYNGTLVTLTFKIADNARCGNYAVTLSYYKGRDGNLRDGYGENFDEDFSPLNLSYVSGNITVGDADGLPDIVISDFFVSSSAVSFDVLLPSPEKGGRIIAVMCDSAGNVFEARVLDVSVTSKVSFDCKGAYVKLLWWNFPSGMSPYAKELLVKV